MARRLARFASPLVGWGALVLFGGIAVVAAATRPAVGTSAPARDLERAMHADSSVRVALDSTRGYLICSKEEIDYRSTGPLWAPRVEMFVTLRCQVRDGYAYVLVRTDGADVRASVVELVAAPKATSTARPSPSSPTQDGGRGP